MNIKSLILESPLICTICIMLAFTIMPSKEVMASLVPISSNLSINGASNLESYTPNPGTAVIDSQTSLNDPLSVSYNRTLDNGIESITEIGTAQANWSNASSGAVTFDLSLSSGVFIDGYFGFDDFNYGFEYDFTATTDGVLTFGGSVSGTSGGVSIQLSGGTVISEHINIVFPTSLLLTTNLVAGEDYRLAFYPTTHYTCPPVIPGQPISPCDLSNLNNSLSANLSFNFQPVPIPAAAWLFGSGLICLISIARRKKS